MLKVLLSFGLGALAGSVATLAYCSESEKELHARINELEAELEKFGFTIDASEESPESTNESVESVNGDVVDSATGKSVM